MSKNIVLGVTGGIAAYKACDIVSKLVKKDINVDVIMTKNATNFVHPLTFQTLSSNVVNVDMFSDIKYWEKSRHTSHRSGIGKYNSQTYARNS